MKFYTRKKQGFFEGEYGSYVFGEEGGEWCRYYFYNNTQTIVSPPSEDFVAQGVWVEVTEWPAGITNPVILQHLDNQRVTLLRGAAIRVSTPEEFYELRGMFRELGVSLRFMTKDWESKSILWWIDDNDDTFPNAACGSFPANYAKNGRVHYNSLSDYINNKPAEKDVRIELSDGEAKIEKGRIVLKDGTGRSFRISVEDWKKINKEIKV